MYEAYTRALAEIKARNDYKVVVRFKAVGGASVMKNNFYKIKANYQFSQLAAFLKRELGSRPDETLFCYVSDAFAPEPEDLVGNLYTCHGTSGHLIVTYAERAAWN